MMSGRGNSRSLGAAAQVRRSFWRAKLPGSAPIGSWVRRSAWQPAAYAPHDGCRNVRQFDPVAAAGGFVFFAIMAISAYAEWLAASWLISQLGG